MVEADVLKNVKEKLEEQNHITRNEFTKLLEYKFFPFMGYPIGKTFSCKKSGVYEYFIDSILIRYDESEKREKALNQLAFDIHSGRYEWGILMCSEGIWLLNDNIQVDDLFFKSQKIVFEILFGSKTDTYYFKYFRYDNLVGEKKNSYFFRDIITYKNTKFEGNVKSWRAYHSALKRFFDYYIEQYGNYGERQEKSYNDIKPLHLYAFLKSRGSIKSARTIKSQFFYIKGFMVTMALNNAFAITADEFLANYVENFESKKTIENIDIKKLKRIMDIFKNNVKGDRDKALFLMLLSFGMERRKLCSLEWEKHIKDNCRKIIIRDIDFSIPEYLTKCLQKLRDEQPQNARYVFGNEKSGYQVPLREEGINEILDKIKNMNEKDEFYRVLTPSNIRKWLFQYLLKQGQPLQDIMVLLDISIANLDSYIKNNELSQMASKQYTKEHPLNDLLLRLESSV